MAIDKFPIECILCIHNGVLIIVYAVLVGNYSIVTQLVLLFMLEI